MAFSSSQERRNQPDVGHSLHQMNHGIIIQLLDLIAMLWPA